MPNQETYGSTAGLGTLNDADFDSASRLGAAFDSPRDERGRPGRRLDNVRQAARQSADRVDTHVHVNPYPYVLCAFGLGLVAGSLLGKRPIQ